MCRSLSLNLCHHLSHLQVSDHGAWGDQKNSFYNGNEISEESGSDGADNLEQEEIELAEKKLSGVLMEADYESHWPEVNKLAVSRSCLNFPLISIGLSIGAC